MGRIDPVGDDIPCGALTHPVGMARPLSSISFSSIGVNLLLPLISPLPVPSVVPADAIGAASAATTQRHATSISFFICLAPQW
jgi:hypothetical protein